MLRNLLKHFRKDLLVGRYYATGLQTTNSGPKIAHDMAMVNIVATIRGLKPPQTDGTDIHGKIDPVINPFTYKTPSVGANIDNLIFGIPIAIRPEVSEPERTVNTPIKDPNMEKKTKIEAHKRDKYWKRRGMKHHRYLRWRKRNETMLGHREVAKQAKKAVRLKMELESIWKDAGLEKEPPTVTKAEKETLMYNWKEEGIWVDALTQEEVYNFSTPPEPRDKKVLPPKNPKHIPR